MAAGDFERSGGRRQDSSLRARGPWGTTRLDERRWGYPPPRRDRIAELEERVEWLERALASFLTQ